MADPCHAEIEEFARRVAEQLRALARMDDGQLAPGYAAAAVIVEMSVPEEGA